MSDRKNAIRIEVEYNNGLIDYAEGKAATEIWNWLVSCQTMNLIHGARYEGKDFESKKRSEE